MDDIILTCFLTMLLTTAVHIFVGLKIYEIMKENFETTIASINKHYEDLKEFYSVVARGKEIDLDDLDLDDDDEDEDDDSGGNSFRPKNRITKYFGKN